MPDRWPEMQFEVERDTVLSLTGKPPEPGLRIAYRLKGERRWTRFVAVGADPADEELGATGLMLARQHWKAVRDA